MRPTAVDDLAAFLLARNAEREAEAVAQGDTVFGAFARLHAAVDQFKVAVLMVLPSSGPLRWYARRHYAAHPDYRPEWATGA